MVVAGRGRAGPQVGRKQKEILPERASAPAEAGSRREAVLLGDPRPDLGALRERFADPMQQTGLGGYTEDFGRRIEGVGVPGIWCFSRFFRR